VKILNELPGIVEILDLVIRMARQYPATPFAGSEENLEVRGAILSDEHSLPEAGNAHPHTNPRKGDTTVAGRAQELLVGEDTAEGPAGNVDVTNVSQELFDTPVIGVLRLSGSGPCDRLRTPQANDVQLIRPDDRLSSHER